MEYLREFRVKFKGAMNTGEKLTDRWMLRNPLAFISRVGFVKSQRITYNPTYGKIWTLGMLQSIQANCVFLHTLRQAFLRLASTNLFALNANFWPSTMCWLTKLSMTVWSNLAWLLTCRSCTSVDAREDLHRSSCWSWWSFMKPMSQLLHWSATSNTCASWRVDCYLVAN